MSESRRVGHLRREPNQTQNAWRADLPEGTVTGGVDWSRAPEGATGAHLMSDGSHVFTFDAEGRALLRRLEQAMGLDAARRCEGELAALEELMEKYAQRVQELEGDLDSWRDAAWEADTYNYGD